MSTTVDRNNEQIAIDVEKCTGCLNCQFICSFTYTEAFNPSQARIVIDRRDIPEKISFTEECTNCNICADYCLYGAITVRDAS